MRSDSRTFTTPCLGCQQVSFISNEAVCPPFTWYDWNSFFNRTFKCLEEFLNITISGRRYICENFSDYGRGENFINKTNCRFEWSTSIKQHARYFQFSRTKCREKVILYKPVLPFCSEKFKDLPINIAFSKVCNRKKLKKN